MSGYVLLRALGSSTLVAVRINDETNPGVARRPDAEWRPFTTREPYPQQMDRRSYGPNRHRIRNRRQADEGSAAKRI